MGAEKIPSESQNSEPACPLLGGGRKANKPFGPILEEPLGPLGRRAKNKGLVEIITKIEACPGRLGAQSRE